MQIETRYPVILSQTSWVTKLTIKQCHEDGHHSTGTNHTLAVLSPTYWIMSPREVIREVEKDCMQKKESKVSNTVDGSTSRYSIGDVLTTFY